MDLCIYCQVNPATTNDHVPPKGLFKEPRPSNLITVPACFECNASFQKDDEYFLTIALDIYASQTEDGAGIVKKQLRSMRRRESRGKWKPLLNTLMPVELRSKAGLILGNSVAIRIDTNRLAKTVNRIIRGLYYEVVKSPLPVDALVGCLPLHEYVKRHPCNSCTPDLVDCIPILPSQVLGDGTFEFRQFIVEEQTLKSFWYLEFYGRLGFVGTTGGRRNVPDQPVGESNNG